ncbi:MAG: hypothetical protein WA982_01770 [Rubrobacteraceae bacterium]
MNRDRPIRSSEAQTFRWVAVGGFACTSVLFLILGQFLLASIFMVMGLGMLVEATRLDERSMLVKRLGLVLVVVSGALAVIYFYTVIFS